MSSSGRIGAAASMATTNSSKKNYNVKTALKILAAMGMVFAYATSGLEGGPSAHSSDVQVVVPRSAICPVIDTHRFCPAENFSLIEVQRACRATAADPYLSEENLLGVDSGRGKLTHTPPYVNEFLHPGIFLSPDGTIGYPIDSNGKMITQSQLREMQQKFQEYLAGRAYIYSEEDMVAQFVILRQFEIPHPEGILVSAGSEKFYTDVSPVLMRNHQAFISQLRSWIGNLERLSDQQIVDNILKAHGILMRNTGEIPDFEGVYRKANVFVFRDQADDQERAAWYLTHLVRHRGGSREDKKVVEKMFERAASLPGGLNDIELTEREIQATSYIFSRLLVFRMCHF